MPALPLPRGLVSSSGGLLITQTGSARLVLEMPIGPREQVSPGDTVRGPPSHKRVVNKRAPAHYHAAVSSQRAPGGCINCARICV